METTKQQVLMIGGEYVTLPVKLTFQVGNGAKRIARRCRDVAEYWRVMGEAHADNWNLLSWTEAQ